MTITQVASVLGITPLSVHNLRKAGRLQGAKLGNQWHILEASVRAVLGEELRYTGKVGRPEGWRPAKKPTPRPPGWDVTVYPAVWRETWPTDPWEGRQHTPPMLSFVHESWVPTSLLPQDTTPVQEDDAV